MSSFPLGQWPLGLAAIALVACAGGPSATQTTDTETAADPSTNADLTTPATTEERAIGDRLPVLERANFWAREHAIQPGDLETSLKFADALRSINSHARAADVLTQTEVLHPNSGALKLARGRALSAIGEYDEARGAFEGAVRLLPDSADALAALGLANDRLGDHTSAQVAYRQALVREPDRVSTLSNLGLSLALTGDLAAAETALERAVALDGDQINARQNLALVLGLQGRYEDMLTAAGDAPEDIMQQNADLLRSLRGDAPAEPLPEIRRSRED